MAFNVELSAHICSDVRSRTFSTALACKQNRRRGCRFHFDVPIAQPLIGIIVRYEGSLKSTEMSLQQ
jgi:hypothetical protein